MAWGRSAARDQRPVCRQRSFLRMLDTYLATLYFLAMQYIIHNVAPLSLAALVAAGVIFLGCSYLVAPERAVGSFGLKLPASDPDTRAWLRLKGIRDLGLGLLVLAMLLIADRQVVGITLLVAAIVPLGDMSIILGSGGSRSKAFFIHGATCAALLVAGLLLIHAV